jgi:hypothetical protein
MRGNKVAGSSTSQDHEIARKDFTSCRVLLLLGLVHFSIKFGGAASLDCSSPPSSASQQQRTTTTKACTMDTKSDVNHVESISKDSLDVIQVTKSKIEVSGTVKLIEGKTIYIPTPTADPQGKTMLLFEYSANC